MAIQVTLPQFGDIYEADKMHRLIQEIERLADLASTGSTTTSGGSGTTGTFAGLDDTDFGVLSNDDLAFYDSTSATWKNRQLNNSDIVASMVTQHEGSLTINTSQISDWGGPYAPNVHTHVEADITDLQDYLLAADNATITGAWTFQDNILFDNNFGVRGDDSGGNPYNLIRTTPGDQVVVGNSAMSTSISGTSISLAANTTVSGTLNTTGNLSENSVLVVTEDFQVNTDDGLEGGGDLTTNRTIGLAFDTLTLDTPLAADEFAFYDAVDLVHKSITFANLNATLDHGSLAGLLDDDHTQYARTDGTRAQDAAYFAERADHVNTPGSGFGELWIKNDTRPSLMFTDESGIDEILNHANPGEPNGFVDRADCVLSWDNGTRTLTLTGTYEVWSDGNRFTITNDSFQISNTEGDHFIYYDETGTLVESATFLPSIISTYCFVAYVYWDATNSEAVPAPVCEQHGSTMDARTHTYLHNTQGTKYQSGLLLTLAAAADSSGALDSHAQFSSSTGIIWDEDILHTVVAHGTTDTIPVLYKSGAGGDWRMNDSASFPVITTGTGRAAWNEDTGATWQLTEVGNNNFVLAHIYAIPGINETTGYLVAFVGEDEYTNLSAAREGALVEINQLNLDGLPSVEFKEVATIIFQTSNSYANAVKSRVRSTDAGEDYIDWRASDFAASGVVSSSVSWGSITGVLANQVDLAAEFGLVSYLADNETITGAWTFSSNVAVNAEIAITANAPGIEQYADSNAGARRINSVFNWDNVSAYEEIFRSVLLSGAGRVPTLDWQTYNGSTYSTKIRFDAANHTIAFPSGINDIGGNVTISSGNLVMTGGDISVDGTLSITSNIQQQDSVSNLTIYGGFATGANIELYGGSHATQANNAFYDAETHTLRNQNATNTFMTMGAGAGGNIWTREKLIAISGNAIRWQDATEADSVEMVHDGTDFNIATVGTTQIEVSGTNLALTKTGAQGDAVLTIEADSDNANEASNPILQFYQDGQVIGLHMGLTGLANEDAKGNTFTGANNNSFAIHFDTYTSATDHIHIGSRGAVALTIDNNNDLVLANDLVVNGGTYPGGQTIGYIRAVTGSYGSIEVIGADGALGTWSGYNIGGEAVFMSNLTGVDSTNRFGLYNDIGNRWAVQYNANGNGEVVLYGNNNAGGSITCLQTRGYDILGVSSGAQVKDHGGTYRDVGFNTLSDFNNNASDILEAGHCGAVAFTNNTTAYTLTLAASTDLDFPIDGVTTVVNAGTSGDYTITEGTSTTLYYVEPGVGRVDTAGGCTVGPGGVATIWRQSSTVYYIWGSEITA